MRPTKTFEPIVRVAEPLNPGGSSKIGLYRLLLSEDSFLPTCFHYSFLFQFDNYYSTS